jgi:hypothetical protein
VTQVWVRISDLIEIGSENPISFIRIRTPNWPMYSADATVHRREKDPAVYNVEKRTQSRGALTPSKRHASMAKHSRLGNPPRDHS